MYLVCSEMEVEMKLQERHIAAEPWDRSDWILANFRGVNEVSPSIEINFHPIVGKALFKGSPIFLSREIGD